MNRTAAYSEAFEAAQLMKRLFLNAKHLKIKLHYTRQRSFTLADYKATVWRRGDNYRGQDRSRTTQGGTLLLYTRAHMHDTPLA